MSLGTQPVVLAPFRSNGQVSVFACCDRPTVVHSAVSGKLLFSTVNMNDVNVMASFHSSSFPECLALASPSQLTIGTIDAIQKLHVTTIPLAAGEMGKRIAYHASSKSLVVAVSVAVPSAGGDGRFVERHFIKVYDSSSFELVATLPLEEFEQAMSLITSASPPPPCPCVCGHLCVPPSPPQ